MNLFRVRRAKKPFTGGVLSLALLAVLLAGCAGPRVKREAPATLEELVDSGARLMWVGAHPDDESLVGPIFAKAGPRNRSPLFFFVLTHGDGGECNLPEGCHPDVKTVRGGEMKSAAALYRATLQHESYFNAPLPVKSFPLRQEIARIWLEQGDPSLKIARAIREFRPDVLITFDPDHGFTGHPEHQLASRFATLAERIAADPARKMEGLAPFHVANTYYAVNRYWIFKMLGQSDPSPYSETFDARQECADGMECRDVMAENTKAHRTQNRDMGTVRRFKGMIDEVYLYRVDPWVEIKAPYEPAG
jgi:LmbE family N-acetylglucosaminyl deacetylase